MGKGSKGTSSTPVTNTATNPLAKYVTGTAEQLAPIASNGQYTAAPDPRQTAGYDFLSNTGSNLAGWPTATQYDAYGNLITGGGTSPAQPGYAQYAAGTAAPQQALTTITNAAMSGNQPNLVQAVDYANKAAAYGSGYGDTIAGYANRATGGSMGTQELEDVASGRNLTPDSNPYLRQMADAALRQASDSYQMSTAPTTDARFSVGGRYGSGANDAAVRANQDTFLRGQGDITNKFYGQQYQFERGQQDTAAQAAQNARRADLGLGITGNTAASDAARQGLQIGGTLLNQLGGVYNQGLQTATDAATRNAAAQAVGLGGLTTGFNTGLTTQEQALRDYNNFAAGQMIPGNADITAGTGARDLATSVLREPYDRANAFLKSISGAGAGAAGSSSTTPYYSNDIASGLSAASGAASLGKQLGIGSLFSGGGGAGDFSTIANAGLSDLGGGGAGALATGFAPELTAAQYALPALGGEAAAGAGKAAGSFLPFLAASDRRLKEDYRVIGKVGALPLYSFRYKGDPTRRIGFMADEVEKVDPGAVHTMAGGFKAVDYERAVKSALK